MQLQFFVTLLCLDVREGVDGGLNSVFGYKELQQN